MISSKPVSGQPQNGWFGGSYSSVVWTVEICHNSREKLQVQALKGRTNDECRQPTRLTDHFALIADAALAFVCESLHSCKNRIGVEMCFRDHFRFEATASPGIVEVGRE